MRTYALFVAAAVTAGLVHVAEAQPAPDQAPPGAMSGPPPGQMGGPPGQMGGPQGAHGPKGRFEAANVTHDGRLTQDQAQAAGWRAVVKHFGDIDHDNKGYVTMQDIHAWTMAKRERKHEGAGAPPPGAQPMGAQPMGAQPMGAQPMQGPPPSQPQ